MARSKPRKQRRGGGPSEAARLRQQTAEALARGAFQKARDLAKTLCRLMPSPEHQQWLVEATVSRAAQLRRAGQPAEAVTVLRTVREEPGDFQPLLARYARELLLVGDWQTAEQIAGRVTDAPLRQQVDTARIDAAMLQGEPGLVHLPAALRPLAQHLLHGLAALSQRESEAVAVTDLSTDTPLHDWQLLVQGLQAFYTEAPAALRFWQPLAPERVPAAIAAPFRAQIDREFWLQQPQTRQEAFAVLARQLYPESWLAALDEVQSLVAQDRLPAALRRAGEVVRALPAAQQEIRQRLAQTLAWEVTRRGTPRDLEAYINIFGAPPDDPGSHRLQALHAEQADDPVTAQEHWAAYEQELAQGSIVNAEDVPLARALIWCHMGELAAAAAPPVPASLPLAMPSLPEDEAPLPFTARVCYQRSIALAPHYLQAHEQLIDLLHTEEKPAEVVAAARHVLEYFPEHQRALEALADDAFRQERWEDAVAWQARAVHARPHDTALTVRLEVYRLGLARLRAQQGHFDEARTLLTAHLEKATPATRSLILCRLAAVELKAGQTQRGEAWFAQASQEATSRLATVFRMLIEALRMPLDPARTTKLDQAFRWGLKGQVDVTSAVELLAIVHAFQHLGTSYPGLPEHQKLIVHYLKRARTASWSEADLQRVCTYLQPLSEPTLLFDFARRGCKEFPHQPAFPFIVAVSHLSQGPEHCPWPTVQTLLQTAHDLARTNPAYTELARQIETMLPVVQTAMLFANFERYEHSAGPTGPALPDVLEAMADLFGLPFDDEDDECFESDDADSDAPPWAPPWAQPQRGAPQRQGRQRQKRR